MIPKELFKKLRRIQITTSRMVNDVFAGQYQSVFKGRGMEFDEVREYQPGDDIRSIDWNVTARSGQPFVKKFVEERELSVMFLLDASQSNLFGTHKKNKIQVAAEICATLAFSAMQNNDKVGLIVFTDRIEKFVPLHKGLRHILRIIREVLFFSYQESFDKLQGNGTNINVALQYLNKIMNRKSVTFLISDFYADDYKKSLAIANKKHDVIAISINDPRESSLPKIGLMSLKDLETNKTKIIDTSSSHFAKLFAENVYELNQSRDKIFKSVSVDHILLNTNTSYHDELFKFFRKRERRIATR